MAWTRTVYNLFWTVDSLSRPGIVRNCRRSDCTEKLPSRDSSRDPPTYTNLSSPIKVLEGLCLVLPSFQLYGESPPKAHLAWSNGYLVQVHPHLRRPSSYPVHLAGPKSCGGGTAGGQLYRSQIPVSVLLGGTLTSDLVGALPSPRLGQPRLVSLTPAMVVGTSMPRNFIEPTPNRLS